MLFALLLPVAALITRRPALAALPDYSSDHHTEDSWASEALTSPLADFVGSLRYDNADKPRHCRIDLCPSVSTSDYERGIFPWPDTVVGYTVYLRCPYSVYAPVYAHRRCVLSTEEYNDERKPGIDNRFCRWEDADVDVCPGPPLSQLMEVLQQEETDSDQSIGMYSRGIQRIQYALQTYNDAPVFSDALSMAESYLSRAMRSAVGEGTAYTRTVIQQATEIINEMIALHFKDTQWLDYRSLWENNRFLETMVLLSEMWLPEELVVRYSEDEQLSATRIGEPYFIITATWADMSGDFTEHFSLLGDFDNFETNVTVHLHQGVPGHVLHSLYLAQPSWLNPSFLKVEVTRDVEVFEPPPLSVLEPQDENTTGQPLMTLVTFPPVEHVFEHETMHPVDGYLISSIVYNSISKSHGFEEGHLEIWSEKEPNVTVKIDSVTSNQFVMMSPPMCSDVSIYKDLKTIHGFDATIWFQRSQTCRQSGDSFRSISCHCMSLGLYAVAADGHYIANIIVPGPVYPSEGGGSFSEFLGFPYIYEVYVTGGVLRALSLVCLVVTIVSYAVFSKARHGVPTRILLHLSVSLVLLNLTLYLAEYISYQRWGCRISNVLRYYLVMVSLSWNVTEAVNLYRMLVKVFRSHVRRFVLKAAVLAWGLPLIPIVVIMGLNHRGFDGIYIEDCSLKCVLQTPVFYYAYLLPMGLMVTCNIVIFCLVVRVLRRHSPTDLRQPDTSRSSAVKQLLGAVSMMFLLGIPWIFSAFGALNVTGDSDTVSMFSGIFQVISVVFLNLQGTFIFLFHCVRNSDMRREWRASLCHCWEDDRSGSTTSQRATGTTGVSATQSSGVRAGHGDTTGKEGHEQYENDHKGADEEVKQLDKQSDPEQGASEQQEIPV